jgi:hypothetical protein
VISKHHHEFSTWGELHRPAHEGQRQQFGEFISTQVVTREAYADPVAVLRGDPLLSRKAMSLFGCK